MESSDDNFLHYRISNSIIYIIDIRYFDGVATRKKKENNKRALNMI